MGVNSKIFSMNPVTGNPNTQNIGMNSLFGMEPIYIEDLSVYDFIVLAGISENLTATSKRNLCNFLRSGKSVLWINDQDFKDVKSMNCSLISDSENIDRITGFDPYTSVSTHEVFTDITTPGTAITSWNKVEDVYQTGYRSLQLEQRLVLHEGKYFFFLYETPDAGGNQLYNLYSFDPNTEITELEYTFPSVTTPLGTYSIQITGNFTSWNGYLYIGFAYRSEADNTQRVCEIWRSEHGSNWTLVHTYPAIGGTPPSGSVVYETPCWGNVNHLVETPDGTELLAITERFDNGGGFYLFGNYTWYTTDGTTWTQRSFSAIPKAVANDYQYSDDIVDSITYDGKIILSYQYRYPVSAKYATIYYSDDDGLSFTRSYGGPGLSPTLASEDCGFLYLTKSSRIYWSNYYATSKRLTLKYSSTGLTFTSGQIFNNTEGSNVKTEFIEHNNEIYIGIPYTYITSKRAIFKSSDFTTASGFGSSLFLFEDDDAGPTLFATNSDTLYALSNHDNIITPPNYNFTIYRGDRLYAFYADNYVGITEWAGDSVLPGSAMSLRESYLNYGNVAFFVLNETGNQRYISIADSNLFTNSGTSYNLGQNSKLKENIFKWLGNYTDPVVTRSKLLWITGIWDVATGKENWMNVNSIDQWGCSILKTYLESIGFSITQIRSKINLTLGEI